MNELEDEDVDDGPASIIRIFRSSIIHRDAMHIDHQLSVKEFEQIQLEAHQRAVSEQIEKHHYSTNANVITNSLEHERNRRSMNI